MASTKLLVELQQTDQSGLPIFVPSVSVIIPHYNDLENLRECRNCLRMQTMDHHLYEIIVSDNNSTCGLAAVQEVCEGFARVVSAPKQGAGEARNAGVVAARSDRLAFTDSDCRPAREWLMRGIQALEREDVVGGRIIVSVEDRNSLTPAEAYELVYAFNNRRYVEELGYSVTANMFTRRRWTSASVTTRPAASTSVVCAGLRGSPASIAERRGSHGGWQGDGCGVGPAANRHR